MNLFQQFLLHNLLPAVAAGLLSWLFVLAAIKMLRIEYGWLRISLLYVPLIKSILVLLGIGPVMLWPWPLFQPWLERALPLEVVGPWVVLWLGGMLVIRAYFGARARKIALTYAEPASAAAPRLQAAMQRVEAAYDRVPAKMIGQGMIVCVKRNLPSARLFVTQKLDIPLILMTEKAPTIVFPKELETKLTDEELEGALAHEMAHFMLTNPVWCSSKGVRALTSVSPVASLLSGHLKREEEMACDDMAITALGEGESYPEMLLKSYRFATAREKSVRRQLQMVPHLLGGKPNLSARVERLVGKGSPQKNLAVQFCMMGFVCLGFVFIFGIV